ncbi:type VI-A CRISPR-associated RNA-guided ribonuclease Cas13a [Leptotrichia sp. OH3620_COT-345]|uniref:type VI-A CRISPR-associated RNA-guided ribonuclease Cas13a n=1 Tax=Leptotrichia sp. OH3620_COT-345 TaxID=2491048 RepID=UPI0013158444|nr:type VI-A CRISPR-associated RNA-guided ribonuclease Cas13a [Leptotrichia sp. OH3620_COT-345]
MSKIYGYKKWCNYKEEVRIELGRTERPKIKNDEEHTEINLVVIDEKTEKYKINFNNKEVYLKILYNEKLKKRILEIDKEKNKNRSIKLNYDKETKDYILIFDNKKIRVKREYITKNNNEIPDNTDTKEKNKYIVKSKRDEDKIKITNSKFIEKLIEYKTENNIQKDFNRKFHMGNILFKLKKENILIKGEDIVDEIEVLSRTENLSKKITRKKLKEQLKKQLDKGKLKENSKEIYLTIKNENIKIKLEYNKTKFDRNKEEYILSWKKIDEKERQAKIEVYRKFQNINEKFYYLIENFVNEEQGEVKNLKKRYFRDYIEILFLEKEEEYGKIVEHIEEIKKKNSENKKWNIDKFVEFYSNVGGKKATENKKIFVNKILNYICNSVKLTKEDIVDYIIGELKYWDIAKRVELKKKETQDMPKEKIEKARIKTYVEMDKHEKFKEKGKEKNEIVKLFIKDIESKVIRNKIEKILKEFKIEKLVNDLKDKIKEEENFDTEIFGLYKGHYKSIFKKDGNIEVIGDNFEFEKMPCNEKELYKIIYRYIKGRIEKILINRREIRENSLKIEKILNFDSLLNKIEKRVKQYTLEHIMYLGKIKHNNIDMTKVNTNDFSKLHAKEELDLELIAFFAATNMELNKIFSKKNAEGTENIDFFGGDRERDYILDKKISNSKLKIMRDLKFLDDKNEITENFKSKFIKIGTNERNKILHANDKRRNQKEILENDNDDKTRDQKGTLEDYNKVVSIIQNLKISNEEISKALNLDVVFKGKEKIISKINNIDISKENNKIIKFLPSFSKVLPEILNLYKKMNKNNPFDTIETERIIRNALIYINKELYKKLILEKDLGKENNKYKFLKELKKTLSGTDEVDKPIIENYYKNSQILASKGNNKAIKKYQKKVIECYIEYLKKNYKEIFDFSNFNMDIKKIKQKIKDINDNKTYRRKVIIKSDNKSIEIKNDFEYIISIFALLNNNVVINKIRNRLFAISVWLDRQEYQNIIEVLDEIMQINTLKTEWITENWKLDLKKFIEKMELIEEEFLLTKREFFGKYYEDIKENIKSKFINDYEIKKILDRKFNQIVNFEDDTKIKIKADNLDRNEKKILMPKINPKNLNSVDIISEIDKFIEKIKNRKALKLIFNSKFLKKYKEIIDNLIENEDKFEKVYYPEKNKNELYIYKKNLFLNIGNPNFDNIYELISEDIKVVDTKVLFDNNIRNNEIFEIDEILKYLNNKLNGYSKEYKEKYKDKLEQNSCFFIQNIKHKKYESFEKLKENYNEVSEYKRVRDLVEFNYLNKIESYLIDINWKLAIQMARFERDMHYIVNGLNYLDIIELENNRNENRSSPYPKYKYIDKNDKTKGRELDFATSYYNFKDYPKLVKICLKFGINLSENSEINKPEKKSIRNYISHFYIIREPFKKYSIAEQIDKVSEVMEYSTRYNNSTYNSVFEVFKKDVDLNYNNLKRKFRLSDNCPDNSKTLFEIKNLINPKKVSVLELEHYNSEYVVKLIEKILTKKL